MRKIIQLIITALLLLFTVLESITTYPLIKDGIKSSNAIYYTVITLFGIISFVINLIYLIRLFKNKAIGSSIIVNCLVLALIGVLFSTNLSKFALEGLTPIVKRNFGSEGILLFFVLINSFLSTAKNNITINSRNTAKYISIILVLLVIGYQLYGSIPTLIESNKAYKLTLSTYDYYKLFLNIITVGIPAISLISIVFVLFKRQRFIVLAAIFAISYELNLVLSKAITLTSFDQNVLIEYGKYAGLHIVICIIVRIAIAIAKSKESRREI